MDEDLPEKSEDKTVPKYKQIDKRAGDYVMEWSDQLNKQAATITGSGPKSTLAKRGAKDQNAEDDSGKAPKKPKVEDGNSEDDLRKHFEKGTLSKLTLPVLKDFLTSRGRSAAGKKADLVERVEEVFETK